MNSAQDLNDLTQWAKEYRLGAQESVRRNNHMNRVLVTDEIRQPVVDALLADFINFIGLQHGIDYALYASDLVVTEEDLAS